MHARAAAATTTALLGATVLLPVAPPQPPAARAAGPADEPRGRRPPRAPPRTRRRTPSPPDRHGGRHGLRVGRERRPAHQGRRARRHPRRHSDAHDRRRAGLPRTGARGRSRTSPPRRSRSWTRAAGSATQFAGARVPTLKQYLNRVERNQQKLLLEIKNPRALPGHRAGDPTRARQRGLAGPRRTCKSRLVIQSFSADSVQAGARAAPRHQDRLPGHPGGRRPARVRGVHRPDQPLAHHDLAPTTWRRVHALKGPHGKRLEMLTWTVNDAANARRRSRGYGVDGIITNNAGRGAATPRADGRSGRHGVVRGAGPSGSAGDRRCQWPAVRWAHEQLSGAVRAAVEWAVVGQRHRSAAARRDRRRSGERRVPRRPDAVRDKALGRLASRLGTRARWRRPARRCLAEPIRQARRRTSRASGRTSSCRWTGR